MTEWAALDAFLRTDPEDVGCEQAMDMLDVYAELVAADPAAARRRQPGLTAHISSCGPCAEDLDGLLAAITMTARPRPEG